MERLGYKLFYKGLINLFGNKVELNHKYSVEGPLKWGGSSDDGNGFHFCTYLEDCLLFASDSINQDIDIALVKGSGDMREYWNDYSGSYEMFVARNMEVLKVLSREEIINYIFTHNYLNTLEKFIRGYRLTEEEIQLFRDKDLGMDYIEYYQYGDKKVFEKKFNKKN